MAQNSFQHFQTRRWAIVTNPAISVHDTIMVSEKCPIIGDHVGVNFEAK